VNFADILFAIHIM